MKREDLYSVKVTVAGTDLGTWDKMSGGEVDSEETTYHPGATPDQIALGGRRTISNVTVSKLYDENVDALFHWLTEQAGKAECVVTKQPLDADYKPVGRPKVYSGKLKRVKDSDVDSESNNAALIELEMTPHGGIS